ncbi:adenylate/guanylate cyclase catalytic domain protein [Necator americanus]|uniref:adenylate cyclase n=1 Tax=Necator americanus TaxID=51031 RepID=W2TA18_NECAM|nr:adenylate/guanylate cyclase catalytic domain protein [Necator americanus]ETN78434.1 adenylate/guanylate cyclase catalytic domain protein [Necator americanus]
MEEDPGERTPALGGSAGPSVRAHSSSPRRVPLFERASTRWWNPQFRSPSLEAQYWKCSFPQLRDRFRSGLVYISFVCVAWTIYLAIFDKAGFQHWFTAVALITVCLAMLSFTLCSSQYQRFYMPTSFLCTFLICLVTLLIFSSDSKSAFMTPVASLATSFQVVLLIYTVIPLPLYLCILIGVVYSCLFEMLSRNRVTYGDVSRIQLVLHIGVHLLGVHLFILTQIFFKVRQRKTFLKVGQSLLARKDLELETQFKDHMIQSVMPKKVADELLKDASELRRPSASLDSNCRTSNATQPPPSEEQPLTILKSVPDVRKFRPFTMNLMTDVSILFADIAGFTKMSSNKSADELVNLLNDLFGRFDYLCRVGGLEKISTLGDCYYCVAGCPEPCADHAIRTVEMGLNMIVAIRQFDIDRGQEVNMRVGIHTGKVMCGMVGTKRFKFDVFSNDVTLANEMESTGIAGRVHVSEATAKYLRDDYILEDGPDYDGPLRMQVQGTERRVKPASMKTYFIKGRIRDSVEEGLDSGSDRETSGQKVPPPSTRKGGFKQARESFISHLSRSFSVESKIAGKLKMNSYPIRASGGGSLRMKLAERNRSTQLLPKESNSICIMEESKKSASLQALTTTNLNGSNPDTTNSFQDKVIPKSGSGSNSMKGSRSSGLQLSLQDGSDLCSVGGLDTAISHHHNAASLTRFDTDNKDFDHRLAMVIGQGEGGFEKGFWEHHDSLNRWTLKFNEKIVEDEYRAHFADSADRHIPNKTPVGRHQDVSRRDQIDHTTEYRYSGVFIDVLVAAVLLVVSSAAVFMSPSRIPLSFVVYFCLALTTIAGVPLLSRKSILPCMNLWQPRHVIGKIFPGSPEKLPMLSYSCRCRDDSVAVRGGCMRDAFVYHRWLSYNATHACSIPFSYIMIVALFAHCNFSQLGAWPKTIQCIIVGLIHISAVYYCQTNIDREDPRESCGNDTTVSILDISFASSFFIWEMLLDVVLSIILVGFLNYQFEAAFRMSFYGDVQARRDTQRMQIVRDQADWLLNNVIPAHAVESLKTDTKYRHWIHQNSSNMDLVPKKQQMENTNKCSRNGTDGRSILYYLPTVAGYRWYIMNVFV